MPTYRGPSLILPNFVARSYGLVTTPATAAGFVPAGFEPSYLKNEEPSETARITTLDPLYTRWLVSGSGVDPSNNGLDLVGLGIPNVNLSPGGLWRVVVLADKNGIIDTKTTPPDALLGTSSNVTGVVGNIDEAISAPDTLYLEPTNQAMNWIVDMSFGALSVTPKQGANYGQFVVVVRRFGTPSSSQGTPSVKAFLYESGLDKVFIGRRAITSESSQVLVFPFNFASLTTTSGANIELRLIFTPGDNSSYAKLNTVAVYYETSSTAGIRHDSSWLTSPFNAFSFRDDQPPTKSLGWWPSTIYSEIGSMLVMFLDDQVDHMTESQYDGLAGFGVLINALDISQPVGYIQAGVIAAGEIITLGNHPTGNSPGTVAPTPGGSIIVDSFGGQTASGQTYGADSSRRTSLQVELVITRDELITLQDRIAWRRGRAGAFFFALEPDINPTRQLFTSGWYTLAGMTEPTRLPGDAYDDGSGSMLYVVTIQLEQKL